jgi:acyl-homoserine lactone acylase PvdQ
MPAEYAAFGTTPTHWTGTDVIAEASLVGGIFGKGGGNEVGSAEVLNALVKRFGPQAGRRSWADFRSKNDPEAPTTVIGKRFPYETRSPFSKRGLAIPDPGTVEPVEYGPSLESASAGPPDALGAQLQRSFDTHPLASNWEMVSARESATGDPIGVLGPQVGYYVPQVLMEQELHGPSFDARGTAFPGVNLTTRGVPRRRRRTTSTRSPRSSATTISTTGTRASASRWRSSSRRTPGRPMRSTTRRREARR